MSNDKKFTEVLKCGHCKNSAPMEIVAVYDDKQPDFDARTGEEFERGTIYRIAKCPACGKITLTRIEYHECLDEYELPREVLYPHIEKGPLGLPEKIQNAYEAALRVRSVDANAYAVLIGRVLEMVCIDRNACGRDLNEKLSDLSKKGEIPAKLVKVAHSLRYLRNIGAHATLGELKKSDIPILDNLCNAILEYIYSAPFLVLQVEASLRKYQTKKK